MYENILMCKNILKILGTNAIVLTLEPRTVLPYVRLDSVRVPGASSLGETVSKEWVPSPLV